MPTDSLLHNYLVRQSTLAPAADDTYATARATRLGLPVIADFYLYMVLAGKAFQVRAGTITTPLIGTVPITDTSAELCVDAASGLTIIPASLNVAVRLGTGTVHEYALKAVGAASSSGTAFTPLPLLGGAASAATARVAATAGTVTVATEAATTTRRLWSYANPVAVLAGHEETTYNWEPRTPEILKGVSCVYLQMGAATTGPSFYAHLDFIECPTANLL